MLSSKRRQGFLVMCEPNRQNYIDRRHSDCSIVWIIGVIDAYGSILARETSEGLHTDQERVSGRPFRWCVNSQDWGDCRQGSERLSKDDYDTVVWWLEDQGYKSPGEFFDRQFSERWIAARVCASA